jgi:pSer/pThr/pTyr-binding forkhead associated (FHA) protein
MAGGEARRRGGPGPAWKDSDTVTSLPLQTESDERSSTPRGYVPWRPHLFVVLEGERPGAGGMRAGLSEVDEVALGRGETRSARLEGRTLRVTVPDRKMSATHARLVRRGEAWTVEDLGSTNGTFVNGRRVERHSLTDGDIVRLGRTVFGLRMELPTPPEAPRVASSEDDPAVETLLPALDAEHRVTLRVAGPPPAGRRGGGARPRPPVMLLGETGTGKEVLARAIHAASGRRGPLVAVNCAALTDSLVESQLLGHVRGAFSGAVGDSPGFVRSSHEGTLLLDEIGDLPKASQGVLLRVLQEHEVVPVGSSRPVPVDLRVIAATHQPLAGMAERGEFRRDLLARLQGFTHHLRPLRDRPEDVGLLVARILRSEAVARGAGAGFSGEVAEALVRHSWPLNVRELVQVVSHALSVYEGRDVGLEHLPPALQAGGTPRGNGSASSAAEPARLSPKDVELRAQLLESLRQCDGNVAAVARRLDKAPMQIYRWMRRLGVDPNGFR